MISTVLIVSADQKVNAERIAVALWHQSVDGESYNVPLSATGMAPATHYGTHTWATQQFIDMLSAAQAGESLPPAPWGSVGLTEADVYAVCADLIVSEREDGQHQGHFDAALAANGLSEIVEES